MHVEYPVNKLPSSNNINLVMADSVVIFPPLIIPISDDFLLVSDWVEEEMIPYRDTLSPKTKTFFGVIEAKFVFM